jgi:hypothetical protein
MVRVSVRDQDMADATDLFGGESEGETVGVEGHGIIMADRAADSMCNLFLYQEEGPRVG